jgi:predicted dehydrogenase
MEQLRIGILGASRIATRALIEPANAAGARLVVVAARDRDRAEAYAQQHRVERVADSYHDVIADPEVEAIYNPLANGLHGPWNLAAIAAGKHVLSEKPFASNAEEAAEVRDAAQRAGVHAVEAFHYTYHPLLRRLHDVMSSGELGELRSVETITAIPAPSANDPRWSPELAGGALMDLGCYSLRAVRELAPYAGGEPTLVGARGGERDGAPGVDEWIDAELVFPSGATGFARCNMNAADANMSMRVVATRGEAMLPSFAVPHRDPRLVIRTDNGERTEDLGARPSYAYQLDAFTTLVREGVPLPTNSDDAVVNMQLIDACYRAAGFEPRPRSPRVA